MSDFLSGILVFPGAMLTLAGTVLLIRSWRHHASEDLWQANAAFAAADILLAVYWSLRGDWAFAALLATLALFALWARIMDGGVVSAAGPWPHSARSRGR
jgi:hypothetical protein